MALHLLSQLLHGNHHPSLRATQSFTKVSKDGAASVLAIPLQPLSPLPTSNTIIYESLKKMALYLLSQFLYSLSNRSLNAINNHLRKSQKDGAVSSVADPDPGSGIRCPFDPWIRDPE
jgi:hypothetical protein